MTPGGQRAVSGSHDNTLRVWDLESGQRVRTLEGHTDGVGSVSVTSDGRRAVSSGRGSRDKTLRVWDLERGQCLHILEVHVDGVRIPTCSVSVTPDGRRAVSGESVDDRLRVWDLESGQYLRALEGHTARGWSVMVTPDGRRAVSGSDDKTLRVWDLASGQCLAVFLTVAPVRAAAIFSNSLLAGTPTGEMLFLELRQLPLSAAILTAQELPHPASWDSPQYTARCPVCGQEFTPPPAVVAAMQERSQPSSPDGCAAPRKSEIRGQKEGLSCLDLPASAFTDPRLLSACPHCQHPLQFNPFIVDTSDEAYEASLRRGLAHCRQTPGDDDSTLGHLAALAVHLKKMSKSAEAAEFRREHDALAAQLAAKKPCSRSR